MVRRAFSEICLVNGSLGDPALYIDYPGLDNAILFDAGDIARLSVKQLSDLLAVFVTHHHVDHFLGLDRIVRANLDRDKTLLVFGPQGTIRKVYDRIKSYEYQYFPFQKILLKVHDLLPGAMHHAMLDYRQKFPEPTIHQEAWHGPVVYENADWRIEAVAVEHTVHCYAYALIEKTGYHPDPAKLAAGVLRPGPWIEQALRMLREGLAPETELTIQGGRFSLETLGQHYFVTSQGAKVAYVTDTEWNERTRGSLVPLCRGAWRLYCDSYYATAQAKAAAKHKHMTASHAAELAQAAKVDQLVLMHFGNRYAGRYDLLWKEAQAVFAKTTAELPGPG